jgi:pyrroloquinoline-quinone synthase
VVTVFIEGTSHDRALFDPSIPKRLEPALSEHPLATHYGLPLESLSLTKAHRGVEGDHRLAAWKVMLDHVVEVERPAVVDAMQQVQRAWVRYRDDVAQACGLVKA